MPPAKTAKRATSRTLSAAHKQALVEGRAMSAAVDRYLSALHTPKRRGRTISKATLTSRLAEARAQAKSATGMNRLMAAQAVRDLDAKLAQLDLTSRTDIKSLEAAFVKVAKPFGDKRGISYGAWREAGVPAAMLKRAGITRSRG